MKIIAKDGDRWRTVFIVSMDQTEIRQLTGKTESEIRAGFEIKVLDRYSHLENIESAQPRLDRAAKDLHALADMLARVDIVVPPKEEPKTEGA